MVVISRGSAVAISLGGGIESVRGQSQSERLLAIPCKLLQEVGVVLVTT